MKHLPVLFALGATLASAQIAITEAGPAASYMPTGLPGAGIAQGSYFYIKGSGLGPAIPITFTGPANYSIGIDLAGTRVRVQVGATILDAFPYFVSAAQVNVILPSNTPIGAGSVTVLRDGTQAVFPIVVVRAAYGIFTLNSAGTGPAVVTNAVNNQVITITNALHPGDRGTLWGTGLGAVSFADNQPAQLARLEAGVTLYIGNKPAVIEYAGRTPGLSGLDQINFVVPQGVAGCAVPLVVRVVNAASNFTSIPVAVSGNTCGDAGGPAASDITVAQATGSLAFGAIRLERIITGTAEAPLNTDSLAASFRRLAFDSLLRSASWSGPNVGACQVSIYRGAAGPADAVTATALDAGPNLLVNGPFGGRNAQRADGAYFTQGSTAQRSSFLEPGVFTVTGTGGSAIGPLSANTTIPVALVWSNQAAITSVSRSQDLRITWTGGVASDLAIIRGSAYNAAANVTGGFVCFDNAGAGEFTVPAFVLSAMPQADADTGVLTVGSYSPGVRFPAGGLDYGVLTYMVANSSGLAYQ